MPLTGPRTLCNACGVKYLRHVRGLPRSSKHAAVHKPLKKCKQQVCVQSALCCGCNAAPFFILKELCCQVTTRSFMYCNPSNYEVSSYISAYVLQRLQSQPSKQRSSFPKSSTTANQTSYKGIVRCKQEPLSYQWHDNAEVQAGIHECGALRHKHTS